MMQRRNFFLAIVAIGISTAKAHHNGTCNDEEENSRTCMKRFFDLKRAARQNSTNNTLPQEEAERCFTSNGCQKPLFQGQQLEADIERVKLCKQQLRQKKDAAVKECLEKKAPDHATPPADDDRWGRDKDEQEKRQHYLRWALAKQTQDLTICPVSANGEKVRNCLRDAWKRPSVEEGEKWQKELCNAKKDCLKDISAICQEHMNITRTLKCDCARERGPTLKQEFHDCIGVSATTKDDGHERFWELHHCNNTCANE